MNMNGFSLSLSNGFGVGGVSTKMNGGQNPISRDEGFDGFPSLLGTNDKLIERVLNSKPVIDYAGIRKFLESYAEAEAEIDTQPELADFDGASEELTPRLMREILSVERFDQLVGEKLMTALGRNFSETELPHGISEQMPEHVGLLNTATENAPSDVLDAVPECPDSMQIPPTEGKPIQAGVDLLAQDDLRPESNEPTAIDDQLAAETAPVISQVATAANYTGVSRRNETAVNETSAYIFEDGHPRDIRGGRSPVVEPVANSVRTSGANENVYRNANAAQVTPQPAGPMAAQPTQEQGPTNLSTSGQNDTRMRNDPAFVVRDVPDSRAVESAPPTMIRAVSAPQVSQVPMVPLMNMGLLVQNISSAALSIHAAGNTVSESTVTREPASHSIEVQLAPRNLGGVQVRIETMNGVMTIQIETQTHEASRLLSAESRQLVNTIRSASASGLSVEVTVTHNPQLEVAQPGRSQFAMQENPGQDSEMMRNGQDQYHPSGNHSASDENGRRGVSENGPAAWSADYGNDGNEGNPAPRAEGLYM